MPGLAIRARGVVQGVGFRPTIWHLAKTYHLTGSVWNDQEGVMIHAYGPASVLAEFAEAIPKHLPPLARLDALESAELLGSAPDEFLIVASAGGRAADTVIAADAATCPACLADIADPGNRRYRYPFTNCTHCGPRLSIVRRVPYDRRHTSMAGFAMCPECLSEYQDPADRRFHAQANCCPVCGPRLWLEDGKGLLPGDPIDQAAAAIRAGRIVAIKGLGGFHLACDAANAEAVRRLRLRKRRYAKPFALMAGNETMLRRYAECSALESAALQSPSAPIMLLTAAGAGLAPELAPGDDKLGFLLPYTPLHHLLMAALNTPIVLTSGNVSDEPQCIDNAAARAELTDIADLWLMHDRDIVNRLDDSVARLVDGEIRLLRRARGYCPQALILPVGFEQADGVLAMGAELKNSFCLIRRGQAIVSQHIGDLENAAAQRDYRQTIDLYRQLHGCTPTRIAIDRHPGYLSSVHGRELAAALPAELNEVQHHHAHLAACLAEHAAPLTGPPVLAAIFDGLGLGDEGSLWGGEFFWGGYRTCRRLAHFEAIALPGGTQAIREPWRNAYAQLAHYFAWPDLIAEYSGLDIVQLLNRKPLATLDAMIAKGLNSPPASSCGRWFDAFAAALGLHAEFADYEGQAAIALEILAGPAFFGERAYPDAWALAHAGESRVLSWRGLWLAVLTDLRDGTDLARVAARIHHTLIDATSAILSTLATTHPADTVVLSGGVFQNRLLLEGLSAKLRTAGFQVLAPRAYPANDGGLALGQAVIAAAAAAR